MEKTDHVVPLYHLELVREKDLKYQDATTLEQVAQIFHQMFDASPTEKLGVIYTNSKGEMSGAEIVALGGIESVASKMTEIFRGAITHLSSAIWIGHNHVTGIVDPSVPDYMFTVTVVNAAVLLGIKVMDHVITIPGAHYSMWDHQEEMNKYAQVFEREAIIDSIMKSLPPMPANLEDLGLELPPLDNKNKKNQN